MRSEPGRLCRISCVALLFCSVFLAPLSDHAAQFDYCAFGTRTSLLIVDRTTRFDGVDQDILIRTVEVFFRRQDPGERVIVAAASGAYTALRLVFNECRPGCPEEGFLGRLTSTCRGVLARSDYLNFEARFIATLRALLVEAEDAPASDLFRSVAEATCRGECICITSSALALFGPSRGVLPVSWSGHPAACARRRSTPPCGKSCAPSSARSERASDRLRPQRCPESPSPAAGRPPAGRGDLGTVV
jgi:hypothetical protein